MCGAVAVRAVVNPFSRPRRRVTPGMRAAMSDAGQANCAMIGGSLSVARQLDGSAIGMCALPNGKRCSEQALAGGSCGYQQRPRRGAASAAPQRRLVHQVGELIDQRLVGGRQRQLVFRQIDLRTLAQHCRSSHPWY